jgi:hypothetical protein
MAVPFGFSAGDIAMAIKFTVQVANAMKETGGAATDYLQTFVYWKHLLVTYQQPQELDTPHLDPAVQDQIRSFAAMTAEPIYAYIKRLQKEFGSAMTMTTGGSPLSVLTLLKKTKWAVHSSIKDEKLLLQMIARSQTILIKFGELNV